MKSLHEQDHYEVLEIPRTAGVDEIERAYRLVRGTYEGDSLATYSLFDAGDNDAIGERIEIAYRTLSDESARAEYDRSLGPASEAAPEEMRVEAPRLPQRLPEPASRASSMLEDFEDEAGDEGSALDGPGLRRARIRRGVALEDIADITKVSVTHLQCIEEESFKQLPAEVYVRGFVTAYARTIGLDAQRVVPDFMARFKESRAGKRRGFLLGGK